MKKRLLGLVSIICLLAVVFSFGAFTVSADAQFVDLTTLSFENLTVGATSTSAATAIQTGNAYFDRIHPSGGTMEVMEEGGVKFVRTTSNTSESFVSFRPLAASKADLPAQDYRITITYRLSDNFANQSGKEDKTFVIRSRSTTNSDERILAPEDYATNLDSILKNRDFTLSTKVHLTKTMFVSSAHVCMQVLDYKKV